MKVKGMIESDVDTFKVGDVIEVKLADGVKVQAMAVQQEKDGMVFCLVDCLPSEHPMNSTSTNEGGYEESDLRKKLNGEILNLFPAELKAMMTPFDNGDLLRLPTEREIFGENYYGEYESPYVKQWKPMKKRRNRIIGIIFPRFVPGTLRMRRAKTAEPMCLRIPLTGIGLRHCLPSVFSIGKSTSCSVSS